jgi:hypothetical protein
MIEIAANGRQAGREPAHLVVNADDYAYFGSVSLGILDCIDHGTVTATGIFANSPRLAEHAAWLAERPSVDVGVHLNLTEGAALTACVADGLRPWQGHFPTKFGVVRALVLGRLTPELIRAEWRAQIERCLSHGLKPVFLNSHEHIHMLPPLFILALDLAREYGIQHVRQSAPERPRTLNPGALLRDGVLWALAVSNRNVRPGFVPRFLGMSVSGRLDLIYLRRLLADLKPGFIYELMCHPGRRPDQETVPKRLMAYHDWDRERTALLAPELKGMLAANNVQLARYRDIPVHERDANAVGREAIL